MATGSETFRREVNMKRGGNAMYLHCPTHGPRRLPAALLLTAVAALAAMLQPDAVATPEFSIENVVVLRTLAPERIPLWPVWSQDSLRIAFTATDVNLMQGHAWLSEIWVMDVASAPAATRLLTESQGATCHSASFVPDDSAVLFMDDIPNEYGGRPSLCDANTPGVERRLGINPQSLDSTITSGAIFHGDIRQTPNGCKMVVDIEKYKEPYDTTSVYLIPTDAAGNPDLAHRKEVLRDIIGVSPRRVALSPSGNELLFAYAPNVALITGLDDIVAGRAAPIAYMGDPRVRVLVDGPNHADAPSWSEDGQLIFYGYDFDGRFHMIDMNFDEANFDVMVVRLADALAGNLVPTRLAIPGNQGCICVSRGGTRIVFGQSGPNGNQICAATFQVADDLLTDESGVVQSAFSLTDGSGTVMRVEPDTVVSNYAYGPEPLKLAIYTPVAPSPSQMLAEGTQRLCSQRVFRHGMNNTAKADGEPVTFNPPATVELTYTDAEIRGLNENYLLVYAYNPETGRFDTILPLLAHDLDANKLTVPLNSVAAAGDAKAGEAAEGSIAAGIVDSDADGLADGMEIRWDGDPGTNIYDPDTNPAGTDLNPFNADTDGDGSTDADEATFGSNPLDPQSTVELPAAGTAALLLAAVALALAARRAK